MKFRKIGDKNEGNKKVLQFPFKKRKLSSDKDYKQALLEIVKDTGNIALLALLEGEAVFKKIEEEEDKPSEGEEENKKPEKKVKLIELPKVNIQKIVDANKDLNLFERKVLYLNGIISHLIDEGQNAVVVEFFIVKDNEGSLVGNPETIEKLLTSSTWKVANLYFSIDTLYDMACYNMFIDILIENMDHTIYWKPFLDEIKDLHPSEQFAVLIGADDEGKLDIYIKQWIENTAVLYAEAVEGGGFEVIARILSHGAELKVEQIEGEEGPHTTINGDIFLPPYKNRFDTRELNLISYETDLYHEAGHHRYASFEINLHPDALDYKVLGLDAEIVPKKRMFRKGEQIRTSIGGKEDTIEVAEDCEGFLLTSRKDGLQSTEIHFPIRNYNDVGRMFKYPQLFYFLHNIYDDRRVDHCTVTENPGLSKKYVEDKLASLKKRPELKSLMEQTEGDMEERQNEFQIVLELALQKIITGKTKEEIPPEYKDNVNELYFLALEMDSVIASLEDTFHDIKGNPLTDGTDSFNVSAKAYYVLEPLVDEIAKKMGRELKKEDIPEDMRGSSTDLSNPSSSPQVKNKKPSRKKGFNPLGNPYDDSQQQDSEEGEDPNGKEGEKDPFQPKREKKPGEGKDKEPKEGDKRKEGKENSEKNDKKGEGEENDKKAKGEENDGKEQDKKENQSSEDKSSKDSGPVEKPQPYTKGKKEHHYDEWVEKDNEKGYKKATAKVTERFSREKEKTNPSKTLADRISRMFLPHAPKEGKLIRPMDSGDIDIELYNEWRTAKKTGTILPPDYYSTVEHRKRSVRVLILIDGSQSMEEGQKLQTAFDSAALVGTAANILKDKLEVYVMAGGRDVDFVVCKKEEEKDVFLPKDRPSGATPLAASIRHVNARAQYLNKKNPKKFTHVIVITDGQPNCSETPVQNTMRAVEEIRKSGIGKIPPSVFGITVAGSDSEKESFTNTYREIFGPRDFRCIRSINQLPKILIDYYKRRIFPFAK
ncbi:hypothetical protein KAW38_01205 [Candidatus Micrarchaeota archaeon]|nr:hypothetical protein [Candidatus Micrarchaeota archaeon]